MCFALLVMWSPRVSSRSTKKVVVTVSSTGCGRRLPACLYIPRRSGQQRRPRHGGATSSSIVYERAFRSRQRERDCSRERSISIVVGHGAMEGELLGRGADPARRPLPRGVPPLAVARRPPQPAQLHRRHQRRRAPPLGLLHDEGTSRSCTSMSLAHRHGRSDH